PQSPQPKKRNRNRPGPNRAKPAYTPEEAKPPNTLESAGADEQRSTTKAFRGQSEKCAIFGHFFSVL
ncbi:MAG: hypothetical protein ACXIVE_18090, partial [Salinarimonas sp.]